MKLVITADHLDQALNSDGSVGTSECCVVAQACKDQVENFHFVCPAYVHRFGGLCSKPNEQLQKITALYDYGRYDDLRAMLPVELELEWENETSF